MDFVKPSSGFHPMTWERVNAPLPSKCYEPWIVPQLLILLLFSPWTHSWICQGAWGCVKGLMKSNILIGQELFIGPKAFKQGSDVVHFFIFYSFSMFIFYPCSNFVKMENTFMDWGYCWEHNNSPIFLINFKVNMVGTVDPCKVVVRKSAFLALPIQMHKMEVKTKKI